LDSFEGLAEITSLLMPFHLAARKKQRDSHKIKFHEILNLEFTVLYLSTHADLGLTRTKATDIST
jgi:hypothetical protein